MRLNAVMNEIGVALTGMTGIRVFDYPPPTITPPAGIVSYPDRIEYDATYGRGMDRIRELPVMLVVGKANDRSARDKVSAWADGSGATSIKALLEAHAWTSCDVVTVTACTFDVVTIASIDYIAALFSLDIAGGGSS